MAPYILSVKMGMRVVSSFRNVCVIHFMEHLKGIVKRTTK